jgi:hypothetical protein
MQRSHGGGGGLVRRLGLFAHHLRELYRALERAGARGALAALFGTGTSYCFQHSAVPTHDDVGRLPPALVDDAGRQYYFYSDEDRWDGDDDCFVVRLPRQLTARQHRDRSTSYAQQLDWPRVGDVVDSTGARIVDVRLVSERRRATAVVRLDRVDRVERQRRWDWSESCATVLAARAFAAAAADDVDWAQAVSECMAAYFGKYPP